MDQVETFLKNVADMYETLLTDNDSLKVQLASMEGELDDFRTRRHHLEEALVSAQVVTDEMKINARKEAELIVKDAEHQADRWIADANTQVLELKRELNALEVFRREYEIKLRSLLESHLELLDAMRVPEQRDGEVGDAESQMQS
ncbi:uncharacterized protein METZ01_LOCUS336109 [marine metagenome]|uniref:Uncharacterized protein n=1 Tax=marine metagenome TaxID=408172 RepID=A0A382QEF8_9ZZZZ